MTLIRSAMILETILKEILQSEIGLKSEKESASHFLGMRAIRVDDVFIMCKFIKVKFFYILLKLSKNLAS